MIIDEDGRIESTRNIIAANAHSRDRSSQNAVEFYHNLLDRDTHSMDRFAVDRFSQSNRL